MYARDVTTHAARSIDKEHESAIGGGGVPVGEFDAQGEVEHERDRKLESGVRVAVEIEQRAKEEEVVDGLPI